MIEIPAEFSMLKINNPIPLVISLGLEWTFNSLFLVSTVKFFCELYNGKLTAFQKDGVKSRVDWRVSLALHSIAFPFWFSFAIWKHLGPHGIKEIVLS